MLQLHGSGKTAVLVERIINKIINENIDIDKLLVVTFTNAAASEMRERILDSIYKKIEETPENENLQRQIILLNKASICTIDSFCLDIIKNNFYKIDISPNFRIGDSAEIELLKQEVLEELFEEKYEKEDSEFIELIQTYTTYRDDMPLKELILKIYQYIQSDPFPKKWLRNKIEMFNLQNDLEKDFAKTIWGEILLEELNEEIIDSIVSLENIKKDLSKYKELDKFYKTIQNDIEQLKILQDNLDSWDKAYNITKETLFVKWPVDRKITLETKEKSKNARDYIKKKINTKINKILLFTSNEANQDIYNMYNILTKLENLILEFDKRFIEAKKEKNIVDFSDIEHLALNILVEEKDGKIIKTDVAKMYEEKFQEIAIDEYQDSNLIQEYILTSISNGSNIFSVGDVKQSIYKFRQARPELFLDKYNNYKLKQDKKESEDLKIQLFKNFRSRKNILDFTNIIFENIMSINLGDIDYRKQEYLNLGANYETSKEDLKTEINIIDIFEDEKENKEEINEENTNDIENEERLENTELEAKFVAKRIKELINNKFQVYDLKKQKFRDINYKDIVILLRSTKNVASVYERELNDLEIPVYSDTSSEYLDSIEIQTIISLLKIIDNPLQDIPLVTVMRSSIGNFTDDDLVQIRLTDKYDDFYTALLKAKINVGEELKEKIDKFLQNLSMWRKEQEYLSLDELIWKIYSDTSYYNYVGLMPNGSIRQANLKMLFERAKQYETASFKGLFNFIKFIEKLHISNNDLTSAKTIGENENVVRIMSIHKSKGLEFPVVFLCNTNKKFNLMDLNNDILLDQDIGIGAKYINYERKIEYDTLSKSAIRNKLLKSTLSEEMRILYVALTRAKEKIIITGISKNYEKETDKMKELVNQYKIVDSKINYILLKKYTSYIDWIKLVYLYNIDKIKEYTKLNIYNKKDILYNKKLIKEDIDVVKKIEERPVNTKLFEEIKRKLEYNYSNKIATVIPTKTSITEIAHKDIENTSTDITLNKPNFLDTDKKTKITSAQKGTLVHLCMQKLELNKKYTLDDIKDLIFKLKENHIISEKEAEAINPIKIYKFTQSTVFSEMQTAKKVERERPFYINIPAKELYNEDTEESILVQGIIDLYYINKEDELILLDYKTDYVENGKEEELIKKHKQQLMLYKKALETSLSRKVDKIYLYSVYLDKVIEINT